MMITQKLDPADPRLGFTVGWAWALARRVDALDVLCLEAPRLSDPPANLRAWSMGKEHVQNQVAGRMRMIAVFYRALQRSNPDVIFSHMIPRYTWLAAPYAAARRIPQVLWYTHWSITRELKLALAAAKKVATAVPESFPIKSSKVVALGHGIDQEFFTPDPAICRDDPPLVVHVARLARPKNQMTLLRALLLIGAACRAVIVGEARTDDEKRYETELRQFVQEANMAGHVMFMGGLDQAGVRDLYRRATVAVNLSPPGMFDKAAIEAMCTGVPTITASSAFDPLYAQHARALRVSRPDDAAELAMRIDALLAQEPAQRATVATEVRVRALAAHSLDTLMDRLVGLFESVQRRQKFQPPE